jgi:hypothetical protein
MQTTKLTTEQLEIVGAFSDYSSENPRLDFSAAAKKEGVRFPATPLADCSAANAKRSSTANAPNSDRTL